MWQKCPICNGSGNIPQSGMTGFTKCNVCCGHGIINELTGLPPSGVRVISNISATTTELENLKNLENPK